MNDGKPEPLLRSDEDGVAVLTLNRPDKLNALDRDLRTRLLAALREIGADAGVRAVVLTGAGRAFCAGGDIGEMPERLNAPAGDIAPEGWARLRLNQEIVATLHQLTKPTIAAVNGAAAGLGMDLALACDFIVSSENSNFRMSFILRGLVPDGGGMHFLPRRIGVARAKWMIFSGEQVDARQAVEIGLADRLAPAHALMAEATAWARALGQQPATALTLAKQILNGSFEMTLEQSFAASNHAQAICYTTADHRRLVEAFLATRPKS